MKRIFILLNLLCLIALYSNAQNTKGVAAEANSAGKGSRLDIGVVGSGVLYKFFLFDGDEPVKSKFTFGYDAGLMASITMRERFKLNIQLLYSRQSKTIKGLPSRQPEYLVKDKMNFIEMPIFYALEFKNVSKGTTMLSGQKVYNWFIGAGPTVQYWLNYKGIEQSFFLNDNNIPPLHYKGSFETTDDNSKEELTSANRFQFGINFTGGFTFEPMESHKIMTSLQLNIMQTLMATSQGTYPIDIQYGDFWKGKNHSIRLSVAYLINTKIENRSKGRSTSHLSNKSRRRR